VSYYFIVAAADDFGVVCRRRGLGALVVEFIIMFVPTALLSLSLSLGCQYDGGGCSVWAVNEVLALYFLLLVLGFHPPVY
jgi:hypothetical protein